jgi:uncharacterized DUF497 family protein
MEITFDPKKNAENIRLRGLSFDRVANFDFETATYRIDNRQDYGKMRIHSLGYLDNRIHALVFTRVEKGIRVISFRKANKREVKQYEHETES